MTTTPRWLDEREQRAWRGYNQLHRRLSKVLGQQLTRDSGLSAADYELLVPLSEATDGQLRARDLARMVEWEKSRLSHHLKRMEQRGLVGRVDCPTDARGAFLVLTDAGRRAIEGAAPQHVEHGPGELHRPAQRNRDPGRHGDVRAAAGPPREDEPASVSLWRR